MKKKIMYLLILVIVIAGIFVAIDFTRVYKVKDLNVAKEFYKNEEVLRILDFVKTYPQIDITKEYLENVGEIKVQKTFKKVPKDLLSDGNITYMLPNGKCLLVNIKENVIQINKKYYEVKEGNLEDIKILLEEYNKKGGISKILWEEE